jgi:hypothetical protein
MCMLESTLSPQSVTMNLAAVYGRQMFGGVAERRGREGAIYGELEKGQ